MMHEDTGLLKCRLRTRASGSSLGETLRGVKNLYSSGGSLSTLSTGSIAELQAIATAKHFSFASQLAKNVLCYYYDICLENENSLSTNKRALNTLSTVPQQAESVFICTPNPASTEVKLLFGAAEPVSGLVQLIDQSGRPIITTAISKSFQHTLDINAIAKGIYTVCFTESSTKIRHCILLTVSK
jgi:Secretion system C-terminal sorting domain